MAIHDQSTNSTHMFINLTQSPSTRNTRKTDNHKRKTRFEKHDLILGQFVFTDRKVTDYCLHLTMEDCMCQSPSYF